MEKSYKRIETLANIAIIVVAVTIIAVLVKKFVLSEPTVTDHSIPAGITLDISDVNWGAAERNLLVVLQKGCRYCTESASFYQRLIREIGKRDDVQVIAVLPQNLEDGKLYLAEIGVEFNEVKQASLKSLQVKATPTLILLDNNGAVIESWVGKVPTNEENEVLEKIVK